MIPPTGEEFDAWHPGLKSELPPDLLPQVTLYRPTNSEVDYRQAREAAEFCGLKPQDMIAFRADRLAIHEVLIRVTADFHVPDGPNYEELGLNLRSMAKRLLDRHVLPRQDELEAAFEAVRAEARERIDAILHRDVFAPAEPAPPPKPSFLERLVGRDRPMRAEVPAATAPPEIAALAAWQDALAETEDALEQACLRSLGMIVGGIVGRCGRLMADRDLVVRLATNLVCNSYGSQRIGALIAPILHAAAEAEGYRLLPRQDAPVVLNVKGASAAGKSTIRPLQRELAERLGVPWEDFALVSPDYWRKFLLDYDSMGEDFRYAAMLTGQELEIVDRKLDHYMAAKAARGEMTHLLIDRFRFDSFASDKKDGAEGRLLSRFGDTVFMFFVITPPTETVVRAWKRGAATGRYKAVDDLLDHNVEAYTGMPELFLTWVNKTQQKVHFEFLDNDVPFGERPRTAAFGWNGQIHVLDADCIRKMSRYRRLNVDAKTPEDVYLPGSGPDEDILARFVEMIPEVVFLDPGGTRVLARIHDRKCIFEVEDFLARLDLPTDRPDTPGGHDAAASPETLQAELERERTFTVGQWGSV